MTARRTPALLAWSGGKDAAWTLHVLRQRVDVEVVGLLTTVTEDYGRVSMQGIRRSVLHAQAQATGLPLIEAMIPARCTNDDYERAMTAALARATQRWPGLRTMAFGDLFLEDIRAYRVQNLARIGWDVLTPLFGSDTATLAREMIESGLRAHLCCVDTQQLDASFAGHAFDAGLLDTLPAGVDPCGENGEFHTCVSAGPMFDAPLALAQGDTELRDDRFAFTDYALADVPT
ncbi:adenine nucleotide alpha hydrolase [Pseudoxanthomonas sp. PXM03]|uniref:adenine nucleotide alpha hydrolase n=1 Tax=Pseudoxanthomonas sp. PXM03 TaxID=2769284 RepID=UPI0017861774|nr:adenine nucleotide alpha hydrolase [Pseudoxanthomonas sp. PXM03]MBD9434623.1 adenine nucleotide alpha hydrolase [Pseudoxanthomonas sp. PXM03]